MTVLASVSASVARRSGSIATGCMASPRSLPSASWLTDAGDPFSCFLNGTFSGESRCHQFDLRLVPTSRAANCSSCEHLYSNTVCTGACPPLWIPEYISASFLVVVCLTAVVSLALSCVAKLSHGVYVVDVHCSVDISQFLRWAEVGTKLV